MTGRAELIRRAEAHGVAVSYRNWRGHHVEVPDETLAAVLDALYPLGGNDPPQTPLAGPAGLGVHRPAVLGAVPGLLGAR